MSAGVVIQIRPDDLVTQREILTVVMALGGSIGGCQLGQHSAERGRIFVSVRRTPHRGQRRVGGQLDIAVPVVAVQPIFLEPGAGQIGRGEIRKIAIAVNRLEEEKYRDLVLDLDGGLNLAVGDRLPRAVLPHPRKSHAGGPGSLHMVAIGLIRVIQRDKHGRVNGDGVGKAADGVALPADLGKAALGIKGVLLAASSVRVLHADGVGAEIGLQVARLGLDPLGVISLACGERLNGFAAEISGGVPALEVVAVLLGGDEDEAARIVVAVVVVALVGGDAAAVQDGKDSFCLIDALTCKHLSMLLCIKIVRSNRLGPEEAPVNRAKSSAVA